MTTTTETISAKVYFSTQVPRSAWLDVSAVAVRDAGYDPADPVEVGKYLRSDDCGLSVRVDLEGYQVADEDGCCDFDLEQIYIKTGDGLRRVYADRDDEVPDYFIGEA